MVIADKTRKADIGRKLVFVLPVYILATVQRSKSHRTQIIVPRSSSRRDRKNVVESEGGGLLMSRGEAAAAGAEEAVEGEAEAAEEEQRGQIARHKRADEDGNMHCTIAARKILNDGREQHVKQASPHQAAFHRLSFAKRSVLRATFSTGKRLAA